MSAATRNMLLQILDAYLKRLEGMRESHGGRLTDDWCVALPVIAQRACPG